MSDELTGATTDMTEVNAPGKWKTFWSSWADEIKRLVRNVFVVLVGLWIMFGFIVGIGRIGSVEMSPTVGLGDIVMYSRLDKAPRTNEVIVFDMEASECIGRVIAGPGDKVDISEQGQLFVNGHLVQESRITDPTYPYPEYVSYPLTVAPDNYFVLGDNRKSGVDSRYYGTVPKDQIKGTLITLIRHNNF